MRSPSLPVRRIAVTVPPAHWFHGIPRNLMEILHRTLVDLGVSVFRVPVDAFLPPDLARLTPLLADLRAFRPELALGLCAGNYALICRLPARRDGWRPNLFTEVLEVPTVCLWEHAPLEIADQVLAPLPEDPAGSRPGAEQTLRRVLTHERLVHWSRDSGQTRIMRELGYAPAGRVIQAGAVLALPLAAPAGATAARGGPDVAFVGHVYQDLPAYADPELNALADGAIADWIGHLDTPLWDVLARRIAALAPERRQRLALDRDQTFFWRFAHRLIVRQAQTALRLRMLGAAGVPVACYGNLDPGGAGVAPNLRPLPGHIRYGPELAGVLARHAITIDVQNPGAVHGFSEKPILGFAAGGFVLVDRKRDFIEAFGDLGEAVSYADGDDLAAKVDRFLADPRYRREVGDAMRAEIARRHRLDRLLVHVLRAARGRPRTASPLAGGPGADREGATVVTDLLAGIRSHASWTGARVERTPGGAAVRTPAQAWAYAAEIPLPPVLDTLSEPHLRVRLRVEAGRLGIAVMRTSTGALLDEQVVSATPQAIPLTLELPHDGPMTVIVRNTVEGESRGVVSEASLCDRPAGAGLRA